MFRPWEKYADIATVATGATGTADLPVSGTYYAIYLKCLDGGAACSVAEIKDEILNVKLSIDGVTMIEADAHFLYDLYEQHYAARGAVPPVSCLPIVIAPDHLTNRQSADALAWGMRGSKSFQIEVLFGTLLNIDQVQVYVERIADSRPLGEHRKILKFARNFPSTGLQEITELPTEGGAGVVTTAYHLQYDGSTAVVDQLEAIVNNQTVLNIDPVIAEIRLEKAGRKYQVAGAAKDLFSVPFDLSGDLSGFLPHGGLNDLRLRVTWSGAAPGSYSIYRESYHGVGRANV